MPVFEMPMVSHGVSTKILPITIYCFTSFAGGVFKAPGPNVSGLVSDLLDEPKKSQNELLASGGSGGMAVPADKLSVLLGTNTSGCCNGGVTGGLFEPVMTSQNDLL
jgi:hypothetical protein